MEEKAPYKAEERGQMWIVTGPGLDGIGGSIASLCRHHPLDQSTALQLQCLLNDVWVCSRWQKERELRAAYGISEWCGHLEVTR